MGSKLFLMKSPRGKLIEKDLFKSKQTYKVIIENAHEAIFIVQDNHVKFCNSKFLELLNCSMDELSRTPFDQFVHPLDKRSAKKILSERCQVSKKKKIIMQVNK